MYAKGLGITGGGGGQNISVYTKKKSATKVEEGGTLPFHRYICLCIGRIFASFSHIINRNNEITCSLYIEIPSRYY